MANDPTPWPELEDAFSGVLIKVLAVEDDRRAFLGRYLNGNVARFQYEDEVEFERGDVIVANDQAWRLAPSKSWPDDTRIGIVRRITKDAVVVDGPTGLQMLDGQVDPNLQVGNTVQYDDYSGIRQVVSSTPLRPRENDLDESLAEYRASVGTGGESGFHSFGGYKDVIARARELIETQLERREDLDSIGAQPVRGVIFTGPPGTGKTHLARAIAAEASAEFYVVSGPAVVSKWVGDSEQTLRRLFEAASKDDRAIIFFDEIDSIAAKRSSDSQGDAKRLVAQLLTLLDGFTETGNIIVIAATNRIEDVDEALLRPGRFDWEIEFGLPSRDDRLQILRVRSASLSTEQDLPLNELASMTEGWSGAELSAIWTEAALAAAKDRRRAISAEDLALAFERVATRPERVRSGGTS
ncbi:AAA family ATPase [Cellulomonas sp. JZ18]|uniref:ATP-binding protein n=1 Tax=Cellulomonas sp. JZ18 TaxID=2654191 RepID=UPI0012D46EC2|nr:ATP-binding protein [Cellulomonas sp. JZ18]QGQ18996.1 AAA family ATPase [Cellulomonas sp. JZ18]